MANPSCLTVIPARLNSTRLPRKLLLNASGKSLLEHTYLAARQSVRAARTIVATDHIEIANEVTQFGGQVMMTDPEAQSGTERVAEVARQLDDVDIFVNVQGDEPEIQPASIDLVVDVLIQNPAAVMSTICTPIRDVATWRNDSCVKVVLDHRQQALYFSRSPIPYPRDCQDPSELQQWLKADPPSCFHHVGLYAYRRQFLLEYPTLPASKLERIERLEQLRVLDANKTIQVGVVPLAMPGIDTIEDYRAFVKRQTKHL